MTASEIAETLINGNITDARNGMLDNEDGLRWVRDVKKDASLLTLAVLSELFEITNDWPRSAQMLRRCLTGPT